MLTQSGTGASQSRATDDRRAKGVNLEAGLGKEGAGLKRHRLALVLRKMDDAQLWMARRKAIEAAIALAKSTP